MTPTGPATVGLAMIVLPVRIVLAATESPTVEVLAPTCRYGSAKYNLYFVRTVSAAGAARVPQWREFPGTIRSGAWGVTHIPRGWDEAEIRLRLLGLALNPGALLNLTPDELVAALQHPFREVREQAMLALGL